ncbi:nucleotide exchange factor GrpE [Haloechinothrix sp. LS1_15]|uniref:nucleotide exchange factor GrpE n=1 Tax=Haloechinothrix sp. LS1_15 TaxID=2652248 RepID=UPI002946646D|nr:nucleotide exchange factor GrpE [Haloechinothrix sp. LS1_15]MDV6011123.1 nucleotide exchange factor GrpE [Haloechinothrix sp. LS1_15]
MTAREQETGDQPEEPVVVRDRRKVDPETGELRTQATETDLAHEATAGGDDLAGPSGVATSTGDAEQVSDLERQLAERTADLQRIQAEYANYRKRVDRDREAVIASAKASLMGELLPLLDDIERAESHGDLTGAFKAVADKLISTLQQAGLEPFGEEGEPFDPSVHEAVQHTTSSDVDGPTVTAVLRRGYRMGDRVVRSAMVAVTDSDSATPDVPGDVTVDGETGQPNQEVGTSSGEQEQQN